MSEDPILVVGAGPTGLNLALSLARRGVSFRQISADKGPGQHSRAMAVQARTLEFYRQFGFADAVVERGIKTETAHIRAGGEGTGREVTTIHFQDVGGNISPYPFLLTFPQDDHERFLLEQLKATGHDVQWGAKLIRFTQNDKEVVATIAHEDGRTEDVRAPYICGCDGAHSCVRETLALGFPGGTYEQLFYVADVKISRGFDRDFYLNLGAQIVALMLPVRAGGMQRLIGLVPSSLSDRHDLTYEDIRHHVEPLLNVQVTEVNWFATYRVHHRVADRFRVGRAFLLGDAGHIHSPAGGQGMNTGIGDAINLGWKLADVMKGRANDSLLNSYESERIGFARALVDTTDRAFTSMVAEGLRGELARKVVMPLVSSVATRFDIGRHAFFRTLSQTRIHYPDSPLSEGRAGDVHGGDRLPWAGSGAQDNFAPLSSLDWQVHVYGDVDREFQEACSRLGVPLQSFQWTDAAREAGLKRSAAYLVRPDGYVALASSEQNITRIKDYLVTLGLQLDKREPSLANSVT